MTFSMSFPSIFNKEIGWNILGELYEALLGLGVMINDDTLKCNGQCPKLIHVLAMLMILFKHLSSLTITLRCFHDILSRPSVNELLYLTIASLSSSFEKEGHSMAVLVGILFKIS